jgi:hypothetical protein
MAVARESADADRIKMKRERRDGLRAQFFQQYLRLKFS